VAGARGHYGRHRIADMVSIDERPASRRPQVPGHWKRSHDWQGPLRGGDTCERTTRFTMLVRCHKDAPQSPPAGHRRDHRHSADVAAAIAHLDKELSWLSIGNSPSTQV